MLGFNQAAALTTADLGSDHSVKLLTQKGYVSGVGTLVRVEVLNAHGDRERGLWDAEAVLSADAGVLLSTNRVFLRHGLGTALVVITGSGNFTLTAQVGSLESRRLLTSWSSLPVTTVGGALPAGATLWSGVVKVTSDVTVPAGSTLTLAPNTLVMIDGVASGTTANDLLISGTLNSLGTEDQPVAITCSNPVQRWGQIRHNTSQPAVYKHTSITRGGRAPGEGHTGTAPVLRTENSEIRLEGCNLTDYAEPIRGATGFGTPGKVMQAIDSELVLDNCVLSRARMGPEMQGTSLLCTNTWIIDMRGTDDADGIYVHDQAAGQQVLFVDSVIVGGDDDGIDTLGSTITVERCIVRNWDSRFEDAKGISVFNGATRVQHSLITDCTVGIAAKWSGGAATLVTIQQSTLTSNLTNLWANRKDNAPGPFVDFRITNSVLWGGDSIQSDFAQTNFTLGYCDVSEPWPGTGNLQLDPLFVNVALHDYHLQPFSPCIDSGNPLSAPDPDGSPVDLGCFTFVPPAPRLANASGSGGHCQFQLEAYTNRNYRLEYSTDLSSWTPFKTNFQTTPIMLLQDTAPDPERYYRALWGP